MIEPKLIRWCTMANGLDLLAVEVETSIDDQLSTECIQPATVQIIHAAGHLFSDKSGFPVKGVIEALQHEAVKTILAAEFMHQAKSTDCLFHEPECTPEGDGFSVTVKIEMIPVGSRKTLN